MLRLATSYGPSKQRTVKTSNDLVDSSWKNCCLPNTTQPCICAKYQGNLVVTVGWLSHNVSHWFYLVRPFMTPRRQQLIYLLQPHDLPPDTTAVKLSSANTASLSIRKWLVHQHFNFTFPTGTHPLISYGILTYTIVSAWNIYVLTLWPKSITITVEFYNSHHIYTLIYNFFLYLKKKQLQPFGVE